MYVHPRRRVEVEEYRKGGADEASGWELSPASLERQRNHVRDYRDAIQRILRHAPGGRALDVGCCTGEILHELQRLGMSCLGLEPNASAARCGREHYGVEIRVQTLEEARLEPGSFDAVLLLHTIEHVPDPLELLRQIHSVLKPGGLFVVETPRYDSLLFRLLGRRERNLRNDWHLYFFETSTLHAMLEKAGFHVLDRLVPARTVTPSRIVANLGNMTGLRPIMALSHWLARRRLNDFLALPVNLGDILRLYAIRPPHS